MSDHENSDDDNTGGKAILRMVDFKIPLVWILSGFVIATSALIGMYYQLQELSRAVTAMQISVAAGNSQYTTLNGQIEILKFRLERVESEQGRKP